MATLPGATTTIVDTAGAVASGVDTVCVLAPVPTNADAVPRLYGTAAAIYAQHGYSEGLEYAAFHAQETKKPILFCGLPIATPGAIGRENTSGNTGTSVTTLAAGADGVLSEHDGVLEVIRGGTIGTDQILLSLSMDGGRTTRRVRLGTAASYAIPYFGVTVSFGGGTLVAGDVIHTWHATGPRSDSTGWAAAFTALAAQQKQVRSIVLVGDLQTATEAAAFRDLLNAYQTSHGRYVYGRAGVLDRLPLATLGAPTYRMTGAPTITFAEVGETGDTITRSAGSFIADGFQAGDLINVTGSTGNNIAAAAPLADVSALVLTLDDDDLVAEGPVSGVTIVGHEALTFAAAADTVTRSRGSWLADGFRVGDSVTVVGTASNDGTYTVAGVTAAVLDLGDGLTDEVIRADAVTITTGQTKAAWAAACDAEFATIDAAPRIDLALGRGRKTHPFSGWYLRRSAFWAVSLREYALRDLHVATWRKSDGPTGWDLYDEDGTLVEWDDRVDGGAASAARFTSFRTWANGPQGAFVAQSLTRASDSSLLSQTHNMAVVNVACQTCQLATENVVGRSLILNDDGTATSDSLATISAEVNSALELALLTNRGEGPRCSSAQWVPSADDILNVPEALLTGVLTLNLNGTIHSVDTSVRVASGGQ
jgi:hypothetical protein